MDYNELSEDILYNASIKYMDSIFSSQIQRNKLFTHYELIPFTKFDYKGLYQNDKLKKRHYKRIKKDLGNDFDTKIENFAIR
jgi:hypothetical protein